jgi:hypothetical protein
VNKVQSLACFCVVSSGGVDDELSGDAVNEFFGFRELL